LNDVAITPLAGILDGSVMQVFIYIILELKLIREHGVFGYKTANPWSAAPGRCASLCFSCSCAAGSPWIGQILRCLLSPICVDSGR
jgi:hypothetical protein